MGWWDRLNGFLVECPHCHGFHGRPWNIRGLALVSFLINALSFFFTARPAKALPLIVAWAAIFGWVLPRSMGWGDSAEIAVWSVFMLGPMVINAVLLVRHQIDLIGIRSPENLPMGASSDDCCPDHFCKTPSCSLKSCRWTTRQLPRCFSRYAALSPRKGFSISHDREYNTIARE